MGASRLQPSHCTAFLHTFFKGFVVDEANTKGETPLHIAAAFGDLKIFEVIWHATKNKNPRAENGTTPLHNACQYGHYSIAKFITSKIP